MEAGGGTRTAGVLSAGVQLSPAETRFAPTNVTEKGRAMKSILSDPCCLMFLVVGGIWLISLLWQRIFGAKK